MPSPHRTLAQRLLYGATMVISAFVLTVDPQRIADVISALAGDPRLTLGEPVANRVPVVGETETSRAGKGLSEELAASPGVWTVDLVMVDFSEETLHGS